MTKIIQFGLPYSPNLGDGVISDCLVHAIRTRLPEAEIAAIDLSGRRERGQVVVRSRALMLKILEALPRPMRHRLVEFQLGRIIRRAEPGWRTAAQGAELCFIGGGQLFSDADLNFCLKIAAACDILKTEKVPVAVHAVGVARNWSTRGTELFAKVQETDLRWIGLRDDHSAEAWRDQMPAPAEGGPMPDLEIVRDPGLLAEGAYGAGEPGERIGLCVTAPLILTYHSDSKAQSVTGLDFLAEIAEGLCAKGHAVTLFCNGAEEDRAALADLAALPRLSEHIAIGTITAAPTPETPAELARLISGFRGVVAHRLHACILAFAYRLPVVGIGWDRKVESFFESVGRPDMFVSASVTEAAAVADRMTTVMESGIDAEAHDRIIAETQAGIDRALAAGLGRSIG